MPAFLDIIDAFTEHAFAGNPAAVCLLEQPAPDPWMLRLAAEMNLSETAFLLQRADGFGLRWMTPTTEVDLCGHATLASAHALWEHGLIAADGQAVFHTRSGILRAAPRSGAWIELDFPAEPGQACPPSALLAAALGAAAGNLRFVGKNRMDFLVELADEQVVRDLAPDLTLLAQLPARGLIATAAATPGKDYDFVSRCFFPAAGIAEDPVTGSAHCFLGPYWATVLGKTTLRGYQASPRGGSVQVEVRGARVLLRGKAVTVLSGQLTPAALAIR